MQVKKATVILNHTREGSGGYNARKYNEISFASV
jgi:hypothetical protein